MIRSGTIKPNGVASALCLFSLCEFSVYCTRSCSCSCRHSTTLPVTVLIKAILKYQIRSIELRLMPRSGYVGYSIADIVRSLELGQYKTGSQRCSMHTLYYFSSVSPLTATIMSSRDQATVDNDHPAQHTSLRGRTSGIGDKFSYGFIALPTQTCAN